MIEPEPTFAARVAKAAQLDPASWSQPDGRPRVLAVGEVLWDLFPDGPRLGGASANFAIHATALGSAARLFSRVGDDELGRRAVDELRDASVDTTLLSTDPDHPTGTVAVTPEADGEPAYRFAPEVAWDHLLASDAVQASFRQADAVCFGTLAQRSGPNRELLPQLLRSTGPDCLRVCDLNLREPFVDENVVRDSLRLANAAKLNERELVTLAGWYELRGEATEQLRQLAERSGLELIVWTRGPKGSVLLRGDDLDEFAAATSAIVNSVGAGDAFAAAVITGLLRRGNLFEVHRQAAEVAAYVCSQTGAAPPLPDRLRKLFT